MTVSLEDMAKIVAMATPGPWKDEGRDDGRYPHDSVCGPDGMMLAKCRGTYREPTEEDANAAFIVAAREFVPWAIARIRALERSELPPEKKAP